MLAAPKVALVATTYRERLEEAARLLRRHDHCATVAVLSDFDRFEAEFAALEPDVVVLPKLHLVDLPYSERQRERHNAARDYVALDEGAQVAVHLKQYVRVRAAVNDAARGRGAAVIVIAFYDEEGRPVAAWRTGTTNIPAVNVLPPTCDAWAVVLAVEQVIFRDVAIPPEMGEDRP